MLDLLEIPGSRAGGEDSAARKPLEEFGGRVGIEVGHVKQATGLIELLLQLCGALASSRTRAKQIDQELVVDIRAPRHPGKSHFRCYQRARGLGREKSLDST